MKENENGWLSGFLILLDPYSPSTCFPSTVGEKILLCLLRSQEILSIYKGLLGDIKY